MPSNLNIDQEPALSTLNELLKKINSSTPSKTDENNSQTHLKSCQYYFLAIFGGFRNTLEAFVFFKSLCEVIPGVSGTSSYIIAALCSVINLVFYYSFDLVLYQEGLDLIINQKPNAELEKLDEQLQKIHTCKELLKLMHLDAAQEHRSTIINCASKINDMKIEHHQLQFKYTLAKYFIYGFGALSTIGGEYYMMKSLLDSLLPLLHLSVSTNLILSYFIITLSIVWALGVFAYTEASGVEKFLHPERTAELKLEKKLKKFKSDYDKIYSTYTVDTNKDADVLTNNAFAP